MNEFAERLMQAVEINEKAAERGLWDQSEWIMQWECGTGGCFAGNYALSQGCVPMFNEHNDATARVLTPKGITSYVSDWVEEDLGLTRHEAERLFTAGNDLQDIRAVAEAIIADHEGSE